MKITFFGAARNVTGSKHLIQTQNYNLLLDCGLYQGKRSVSENLNRNLPFPAKEIDAVILSHAHLDHCGTLPILVRDGFKGKIYCTAATADIAKYILLDSAAIQEQDSNYLNDHIRPGDPLVYPIYNRTDVEHTFEHFETVPYFRLSGSWINLNENIRFKFYDAGHILGSAITLLEIKENGFLKTLAFTGDLGRASLPILRSPEYIKEKLQTLIMECTYGDRVHRPMEEVVKELKKIIDYSSINKSKVIVPAFSLGRMQELIYILHKLINEKIIPSLPIYIDSPLAQNITNIFPRYTEDFDEDFWKDFGNRDVSPFISKNLIYVHSVDESKSLNNRQGPLIIVAGSGMAEGGRVLYHLKNSIDNPRNVILITGYQAENTLGRRIQEGVSPVKILGKEYQLKARVATLNEFSAHADKNDLLSYLSHLKNLENLFLVHSEESQVLPFKKLVEEKYPSLSVNIPTMGQSFEI